MPCRMMNQGKMTGYLLDPQTWLSRLVGTGFAGHSPAFVGLIGFQHTPFWPLLLR